MAEQDADRLHRQNLPHFAAQASSKMLELLSFQSVCILLSHFKSAPNPLWHPSGVLLVDCLSMVLRKCFARATTFSHKKALAFLHLG